MRDNIAHNCVLYGLETINMFFQKSIKALHNGCYKQSKTIVKLVPASGFWINGPQADQSNKHIKTFSCHMVPYRNMVRKQMQIEDIKSFFLILHRYPTCGI